MLINKDWDIVLKDEFSKGIEAIRANGKLAEIEAANFSK